MISDELIKQLQMASKYPTITRVGVFGSVARNEETKDSDLDVIVDYSDITNDLDDFLEQLEENIANKKIDFITLNGVLKSKNQLARNAILNDVVWVYEKWALPNIY